MGFGGISVGGIVKNRMYFGSLLTGVDHLPHTHDLARNAFSRGLPEHGAELADELERIVTLHDASNIAAVIVAAVAVSPRIYETMLETADAPIELFHGYTYSAHPLACAAGLATLDLYQDEELFLRAASLAGDWEAAVHGLRGAPHVIDIRNVGLMAGIELAPRPGGAGERGQEVFHRCFDAGLLVRVTGDIIALSPSFIISEAEIAEAMSILGSVLETIA